MFTSVHTLTPVELKFAIVQEPLIVSPETTVMSAIAQMSGVRTLCDTIKTTDGQRDELYLEVRSSCVLVVEAGQLIGILTERDVVRLSAQQRSLENLAIREVMAYPVITLYESAFTDLFFAINLLQQHDIRHLPILDAQDRVMGLVTHESLRQTSRPVDLLRLRLVSEVMTSEVVRATPDRSMLDVTQLMAEARVSSVVIVQPSRNPNQTEAGQTEDLTIPVGIVTERDIVQFQALGLRLADCTAGMVMSTPIFTVTPEESLWTVQQIMEQRLIRRLGVVGESGELLGIVTQSSLLQALNPLELYKLAEVLEAKVVRLETERVALLKTRTVELEQQVEARTRALQAKTEREQLVATIALQIRSSLSLQTILDTTVEQVRQLLGCDRANIWQFDANWHTSVVAESTHSSLSLVGERIEDCCFQRDHAEGYRQGRIRVVSDIYTTEMADCHRDLLIRLQTRAKILVPLLCGDQLWGLLNVTESQHPRDWQPEEVELLRALSVQLAIALQQATTHQQLQDELAERQQTEARLRQSEVQNQAVLAAIPDLMFRLGADGRYRGYVTSDTHLDVVNHDPIGTFMRDVLPPELAERELGYMRRALETGELQIDEHRILIGDQLRDEEIRVIKSGEDEVLFMIRDISDRKQAERQLSQLNQTLEANVIARTAELQRRETELQKLSERLALSLKSGTIGCWEWHIQENRVFWDERTCELYDVPYTANAAWIYDTWVKRLHPDDRTPTEALLQQVFEGQAEYDTEFRVIHANGSIHVLKACGVVMRDGQGQPQSMIGVHFDITERKRTELRLQQQAEQARLLGSITQRLRSSLNLDEILNTTVEEIHQVLHADRVLVYRVFPGGTGAAIAESVLPPWPRILDIVFPEEVFPEENYDRYVRGRVYALSDRDDPNQVVLPCLVDFLAEIQVRAKLVVPIVQNDTLWGLLIAHQCDLPRQWQAWEINLLHQVSNQLAIAIQQSNLFEQLQQELTERQQAETKLTESNHQLAISNQELARATRLKDEFLANMSHELRTPLNAILGMTEGLQDQVFGPISEPQIKALQTVERSGSHLLELINDILDVAKIEAGQIELECTPLSVTHLCKSSLTFIKQQALQKRIQLEIKHPLDLPDLLVDERRVRQVLINLLNNAVKFTPEGGRITLEVTELPSPTSGLTQPLLRLAVRDTGIGIAPENIQKLFQPFIQIDSALNRQYAGTGLGLSLVKRIVELHGGQVGLTSELGVGSCFTIDLPYILGAAPRLAPTGERIAVISTLDAVSKPTDSRQAPLLLLAEDNEANIMTTSSYLGAKGYRIVLAKHGQEAIDCASAHQPDLILMDIQMPGMDGLEAMRQIRLMPNLVNTPIIALTALAMTGDRDRCLAAGANDYLIKPVKLKQLDETIQKLLNKS